MPTLAALAEMLDHQDVGEALTTLVSFQHYDFEKFRPQFCLCFPQLT